MAQHEFCSYCIPLQTTVFGIKAVGAGLNLSRNRHQPSCCALKASAEAGCRLCQIILESIASHQKETGEVETDGRPVLPHGEVEVSCVAGPAGLRCIWVGHNPRPSGLIRAVDVPSDWKDSWKDESQDINDLGVSVTGKWISGCQENHTECASSVGEFIPSRVIDVEGEVGSDVRLLQTLGLGIEKEPYVALSHCWGRSMPESATTVTTTITRHLQKIQLKDLTQTFKDAIKITRRLGVRYLWIDSLCIIQNSKEDWEMEAAQMANVYSNAYFTLAASASSDGTQGCQVPRGTTRAYVDVPMAPTAEGRHCRAVTWSRRDSEGVHKDALQARGWTLQERELSPRIVYFSQKTVLWECRQLKASMEFPWLDSLPFTGHKRVFDIGNTGHGLPRGRLSETPRTGQEELRMGAEWLRLVKLYTRRSLTKQEDVLPAMSGIARVFHQFTPGDYQAGLFEAHGIVRLLWAVDTRYTDKTVEKTSSRPAEYVGPTWSWISVIAPVSWSWYLPHDKIESMAEVIKVPITLGGSDPYGKVVSGTSLFIKGKLRRFDAKQVAQPYGEAGDPANFTLFGTVQGLEKKLGQVIFDVVCEATESIYCLACAKIGSWPQVYGLALVSTGTNSDFPEFKRVGRVKSAEQAWKAEIPTAEIKIV